jgi:hypothetical protein
VSFKSAIIATGSFPLRTPIQRLESDRCVDSEGLLAQTEVPKRLVILGGGIIGASSRRSKIQALQVASFLAAFSAPASGRCKLVNQRIRTEYYWRFTDAAVRVAIKRTTFRFRKKLRVVRLT